MKDSGSNYEYRLMILRQHEQELQRLIGANGQEDSTTARQRARLSTLNKECILDFPSESHADNVDASWWRCCFHSPIDYYRKFLKNPKSPEGRWAFSEICRLIDSGLGTFYGLIYALTKNTIHTSTLEDQQNNSSLLKVLGLPISKDIKNNGIVAKELIIYRCLIFIGDLLRYRCQFNRAFLCEKFSSAWKTYYAARALEPDHGHACNQLAVVASLLNESLLVVYWYLRSLCCQYPFVAAQNNLLSFLEKVREEGCSGWIRRFLTVIHGAIVGADVEFQGDNHDDAISTKDTSRGLFIYLMLVQLYPCEGDVTLKRWLDTFLKAVNGHGSNEENTLLFLALVAVLKRKTSIAPDHHRRLLDIIVTLQHIRYNCETYQIINELSGLSFMDGIIDNFRENESLLETILRGGALTEDLAIVDGVIRTNKPHFTTPLGRSSPLVVYSPSLEFSSHDERASPELSTSPSVPDEVVCFQGFFEG